MSTPNYSSGNSRFNDEALTWDSKPEVVRSSALCLETLVTSPLLPSLSATSVLELGCGTGLLTVPLASHVSSILALDTSDGMIGMLDAKISSHEFRNVVAKVRLLEDANDEVLGGRKFGLVVSHLVMHHVPDMAALVGVMFGTLESGGRVWVSDFEDNGPQAELFHPKDKVCGVLFLSLVVVGCVLRGDELTGIA